MILRALRACVLLTLLAAGCQSGPAPSTLPLSDGFDDPNSGWTTLSTDQFRIAYEGSALHITVDTLDSTAWAVAGQQLDNFVLDVDATQLEGPDDNHYGVIVRFVDERNFYRLDISGDGYYSIQRFRDGEWETLVNWPGSPTDVIRQGNNTNHLRVIADGPRLTWVVNDTVVAEITDADILNGDVGLTAGSFFGEAGVHVAFDNFEVHALEETQP
jgi:hypothetical protein